MRRILKWVVGMLVAAARPPARLMMALANNWRETMGEGPRGEDPTEPKPAGFWIGPDYRGEYTCPHRVGHGNHVHGCDGCCRRDDFPIPKVGVCAESDIRQELNKAGGGARAREIIAGWPVEEGAG
jgi:hypothetical protein